MLFFGVKITMGCLHKTKKMSIFRTVICRVLRKKALVFAGIWLAYSVLQVARCAI